LQLEQHEESRYGPDVSQKGYRLAAAGRHS